MDGMDMLGAGAATESPGMEIPRDAVTEPPDPATDYSSIRR